MRSVERNFWKSVALCAVWYWIQRGNNEVFLEEKRTIDTNYRTVVSNGG